MFESLKKWLSQLGKPKFLKGDTIIHVSHSDKDPWESKRFYTILEVGNRSYKTRCDNYKENKLYVSYEETIYFEDEWLYSKVNL